MLHLHRYKGYETLDGIIDSSQLKQGMVIKGLTVFPPSVLRPDDSVTITSIYQSSIVEQLEAIGVLDYKITPCLRGNFVTDGTTLMVMENMRRVRSILEDNESRDAYTTIMHAWLTGDVWAVHESPYPIYLHPLMSLQKGSVVLDGGAYDGAHVRAFLRAGASRVICVEPIPREPLAGGIDGATLLKRVLGPSGGFWRLEDDETATRISPNGTASVEAIRLYEIGKLDMIKLDIEGKEFDLIISSEDYLRDHHPTMAISIYHRFDHLWKIPLEIHRILPTHKLYIGQHSGGYTDTVLYAIR